MGWEWDGNRNKDMIWGMRRGLLFLRYQIFDEPMRLIVCIIDVLLVMIRGLGLHAA